MARVIASGKENTVGRIATNGDRNRAASCPRWRLSQAYFQPLVYVCASRSVHILRLVFWWRDDPEGNQNKNPAAIFVGIHFGRSLSGQLGELYSLTLG